MLAEHAVLLSDIAEGIAAPVMLGAVGLFLLLYAGFIIAAVIGALLSDHSFGMKLVWLVFICCAPFLGALCWFFIGRRNVPARVV